MARISRLIFQHCSAATLFHRRPPSRKTSFFSFSSTFALGVLNCTLLEYYDFREAYMYLSVFIKTCSFQ